MFDIHSYADANDSRSMKQLKIVHAKSDGSNDVDEIMLLLIAPCLQKPLKWKDGHTRVHQ